MPDVKTYTQMLATHHAYSKEKRYIRKDGRSVWVNLSVAPLWTPGSKLTNHASVIEDITERKLAEEAREESERRLRLHVQSTPVAILEYDEQFRITSWNPAAVAIFGWSAAEAMGRHANFITPESGRPEVEEVFRRLLEGRRGSQRNVNVNITKDGRLITCDWNNTVLASSGGQLIGVAAMALDITERKRAEEELKASEARLRAFVESDVIGILFGDIDGHIYDCNQELARIIGRSRADVLAGKVSSVDITFPQDLPLDEAALAEANRTGHCRPYEKHYVRPGGMLVPVQVGYVLLEPERRKSVAFILDMTERRRADEALRRERGFLPGRPPRLERLLERARLGRALPASRRRRQGRRRMDRSKSCSTNPPWSESIQTTWSTLRCLAGFAGDARSGRP